MAKVQILTRVDKDVKDRLESMATRDERSVQWHTEKALIAYVRCGDLEPNKIPIKKPVKAKTKGEHELVRANEVIDYLNSVCGSAFKHTEVNRKPINARIAEGHTQENCFTVIDKKSLEWKGGEFAKYLRPSTLFQASKFEGYLSQVDNKPKTFAEKAAEVQGGFISSGGEIVEGEVIYEQPRLA